MNKSVFLVLLASFSFGCAQESARKYTILPLEVAESSNYYVPVVQSSNSIAQINFSSPFFGRTDSISPRPGSITPRARLTAQSPLMTESPARFSTGTPREAFGSTSTEGRARTHSGLGQTLENGDEQARRKYVEYTRFCCQTGFVSPDQFKGIGQHQDPKLVPAVRPVASKSPKAHTLLIASLGGHFVVNELKARHQN